MMEKTGKQIKRNFFLKKSKVEKKIPKKLDLKPLYSGMHNDSPDSCQN